MTTTYKLYLEAQPLIQRQTQGSPAQTSVILRLKMNGDKKQDYKVRQYVTASAAAVQLWTRDICLCMWPTDWTVQYATRQRVDSENAIKYFIPPLLESRALGHVVHILEKSFCTGQQSCLKTKKKRKV